MTIRSPTMSRNAVAMRTMSFAGIFRSSRNSVYSSAAASAPSSTRTAGCSSEDAMSRVMIDAYRASVGGLPERRRLDRSPNHASERDDREDVWDHLDELRWHELQRLKPDLHRLGRGEQETGDRDAFRVPFAEDYRRERDEP